MLSLAKVEQLRQQPESVTLDLGEVVRNIVLDLSPLVADKALDFELAADEPVTVRAHQWMLQELTRNLLHNAIKQSPQGAALSVSVRAVEGQAVLAVRDEGPGIMNPENVFVPFFTTKPGGSGIGLALSRQIAEAHSGSLSLANRQDRTGCEAILRLPR